MKNLALKGNKLTEFLFMVVVLFLSLQVISPALLFTLCEVPPTQFRKDDEVFCIALWAGHACCAVAPLFLVHPALQAGLVDPLGGAATATRAHPLCCAVVLVRGKTHPTAPKNKRTPTVGMKTMSHLV